MSSDAAGRPSDNARLITNLLLTLLLVAAAGECGLWLLARHPTSFASSPGLLAVLLQYSTIRATALARPRIALLTGALLFLALLFVYRLWLLLWHNQIKARLSGTYFSAATDKFPLRRYNVIRAIRRRPPGHLFVGMEPERIYFGPWGRRRIGLARWRPVYIPQRQKTMHRHVIGKTGSGKTQSMLLPAILQDLLDGKGVVLMDAKGSDENIRAMKSLCALAGRARELKVFALPAWNQPQLFSHAYNMLYVRPRGLTDSGGDPVPVAERIFSILTLGDNEFYNTQAQICFVNLCKLLHGMVDEQGGLPFVMTDVTVCLKGVGAPPGGAFSDALNFCLEHSLDQDASLAIRAQVASLGRDAQKCFSGIIGAIDKFTSPIVNAYDPDIVVEELLQTNGVAYVQLPSNLFKLQSPAMGRVMLMDIQQEGSLRQVFRTQRNQTPFSVNVDEFYTFADLSIIDSLNKLRDAGIEFTLAHQSIADLELVSKEFAKAVWDNTRTKDILNQNDPELCEKLAKSIGTHQVLERTVRRQQGALFTSLVTGDASTKLVETFVLHPNGIKSLATSGQGYLFNDEGLRALSYAMLPPLKADYPLIRKDQSRARGLRLYDKFIAPQVQSASSPARAAGQGTTLPALGPAVSPAVSSSTPRQKKRKATAS